MINLTLYISEAIVNLLSAKLRSSLALLGILVGTASVVAMLLGGELATNEALSQFKKLGTDLLAFSISDNSADQEKSGTLNSLTFQKAYNLKNISTSIRDASFYTQIFEEAQFKSETLNATILGVPQNFAKIIHLTIKKGRFISDLDHNQYYCVIGHNLSESITNISGSDVIGQQLKMGNYIFTIIGVANPWPENSFVYAHLNDGIFLPISTTFMLNSAITINDFILRLNAETNIPKLEQSIQQYLDQYVTGKKYFFRSAEELILSMSNQSQIFTIFLSLIGSISLIVGGIGVMNIMLMSVLERQREIGIRLAIGATSNEIRLLFLIEAIILSLMGGLMGVIVGVLITYIIAYYWQWHFILFLFPPLIGFSVSGLTGMVFGLYPAHKASLLNPIEALRTG